MLEDWERIRQPRQAEVAWPELAPEDRLSHYVDYAATIPHYQEVVAEVGEAEAQEALDYLFYFWDTSYELLDEPEFAGWEWRLDPHDYLVYELLDHIHDMGENLAGLGPALEDPLFEHMVHDGLQRYTTPAVRRALARRARKVAQRTAGSALASQAEAVVIAVEDLEVDPMVLGVLVESFRSALLRAALAVAPTLEREWAERPAALDRWLAEMRAADEAHPATEAVRRLVQVGPPALPAAVHLAFYEDYECDDYPLRAALEVLAAVPSQQSLWGLRQVMLDCPTLSEWAAEQLAARMPEVACAYFRYLLSAPEPAPATLAARGLWVLAQARCPDALELASQALRYHVEDAAETETVQVAAGTALLALGDPAAAAALRDYLDSDEANPAAQAELVRTIEGLGEGWWQEAVSGQLPVARGQ